MSEPLTLDLVDRDGAIREAYEEGMSRSAPYRRAATGGGTFLAGGLLVGGLPRVALGKPAAAQDAKILNFALTLEYLEAALYTQAQKRGALSGERALFARVVCAHERAHVEVAQGSARPQGGRAADVRLPRATETAGAFAATAQLLEDTGVSAYAGQAPRVEADAILKAAPAIHTVEARHASWIRDINEAHPAPRAFDAPLTETQVLAAVADTRFIV